MTQTGSWHQHAVNAREALRLLGYPVLMEECLEGEPGYMQCLQSDAMHFTAYCTIIKATVDHYLSHTDNNADLPDILNEMYREAEMEMRAICTYPYI